MNPENNSESEQLHLSFLRQALDLSKSSPPKPSNFRVGAVLVAFPEPAQATLPSSRLLSTGYTLELPGNTHAEQCALAKLTSHYNIAESELHTLLPPSLNVTLYTTLEPCGKRLSGNLPCVQRIINTRRGAASSTSSVTEAVNGIQKVIFGAKEPGTFVQNSQSCRLLDEAGVLWEYIPGLEKEILEVAMAGHEQSSQPVAASQSTEIGKDHDQSTLPARKQKDTAHDEETVLPEPTGPEPAPRNPKKRMMEVDISSRAVD